MSFYQRIGLMPKGNITIELHNNDIITAETKQKRPTKRTGEIIQHFVPDPTQIVGQAAGR